MSGIGVFHMVKENRVKLILNDVEISIPTYDAEMLRDVLNLGLPKVTNEVTSEK